MRRRALVVFTLAAAAGAARAQQFAAESPPVLQQWLFAGLWARGDLDGDGDADLFVRAFATSVYYAIFHNDGRGRFTDVTGSGPAVGPNLQSAAFLDFDGDGDDDLFVSQLGQSQLLRRVPGGFVDASSLLPSPTTWWQCVAADFDRDGDVDLAGVATIANSGTNGVARNAGGVAFTVLAPFPGLGHTLVAGDIDADGDLDLFLGTGRLLRNDGGMVFTDVTASWLPAPLPSFGRSTFGDVDGDGRAELLLVVHGGPDLLLRNTGTQLVVAPGALPPPAAPPDQHTLADVDEDGDLDLFRTESPSTSAVTTLALNDGTGQFTSAPARMPAVYTHGVHAVADLDGDGDVDGIAAGGNGVSILWNRHRHVSSPAPPQRGAPWTVELWDQPGYGTTTRLGMLAVTLARLPQRLVLPPFGTLWLDLGAPGVLAPAVFAPGAGAATFVFAIPAVPALAGVPLHAQGVVEESPGVPRLTSLISVAIQ